ncbi:tRNA (N6-isopentenyl adenosine(37)-C2)-methylthiotransferase MiaB [Formicincola oecophyllae]|uniref:tRNA-2-methylthio-N(6)-dimethylallyladenosine synthase n=1 Tax=Formicincola oecophyllae TaxID=2558361 RepID=A0A4Y6U939_9PROT|nr:tRNA (N6-isopentenyl adenosine(37)-C2)-methylthiotransferase MiaB [Formicincola oecophyllae]QDH12901.1 tRNA (N6-isopentenyl adenosine(37)-C2)-methylthiotransferase MiaB [Formicincola oecophyllae]
MTSFKPTPATIPLAQRRANPSPALAQAPRSVHIITWGCQMNVYDSARMADILRPLGYGPAQAPEEADMVILNTCHIREKAAEKVFSELGRLRQVAEARQERTGKPTLIAVAGCVGQAMGEEIIARAPWVNLVLGPQTYHRLPEMVARVARSSPGGVGGGAVDTDFPAITKFDFLPDALAPENQGQLSAFLTVQEGCDKFCTFCVVPYTRGMETSRSLESILAEAKRLAGAGAREITLLGQNVNALTAPDSHGNSHDLAAVAEAVGAIDGIERIRYTTSHPRDMSESLIAAHGANPTLMPFLHLPVQSGSDRILKAMNRGHSAADYTALVERLRAARPDLALSSDFIVGFPGESDDDFEATMALVRSVGFASAYSFKYSPRPGTPAASLPHQVPEDVKTARLARLQALLEEQQRAFNESMVGTVQDILVSGPGRKEGQLTGRSPYLQPVHFTGEAGLVGKMVKVHIDKCVSHSLAGTLLGEAGAR